MHLWPQLKAERRCPGAITILRRVITVTYIIWKCETEVHTRRNHGTSCRDPAPQQMRVVFPEDDDSDDPQF